MANISDASGRISILIKDKDRDRAKQLLADIFNVAGRWAYGTYVEGIRFDSAGNDIDDKYFKDTPDGILFESSFDGSGRWAYSSNIEMFMATMDYSLGEESELYPPLNDKNRIRKDIESEGFEITFDYADIEPGCLLLEEGFGTIRHDAGTPIRESVVDLDGIDSHEWCKENIDMLFGDGYYDENFADDEYDRKDAEDIKGIVSDEKSKNPQKEDTENTNTNSR